MDNKRKALGRGLEQLFSNEALDIEAFEKKVVEDAANKDIVEVRLEQLRSNPYQPRMVFDEEKLNELAQSIKQYGVIQPIIIKKSIKDYEIVAGERRVRASRIAGLQTIPAIIKDLTDEEMMSIAVLENIQREDLSAIEEAEGFRKLIQALNITQEELSLRIGKSRSYVTNLLGLLRLPQEVKSLVSNKSLSLGHAKILSKLEDSNKIIELALLIVKDEISVRTLETMVKALELPKEREIKKRFNKNYKYEYIENIMRDVVGTTVKINEKNITIPFDSEKDLQRILEILHIKVEDIDG